MLNNVGVNYAEETKSNIGRNTRKGKRIKFIRACNEEFYDSLEDNEGLDLRDEEIRVRNRDRQTSLRQNRSIKARWSRRLKDKEGHRIVRKKCVRQK